MTKRISINVNPAERTLRRDIHFDVSIIIRLYVRSWRDYCKTDALWNHKIQEIPARHGAGTRSPNLSFVVAKVDSNLRR
jgi:hypothetical protein